VKFAGLEVVRPSVLSQEKPRDPGTHALYHANKNHKKQVSNNKQIQNCLIKSCHSERSEKSKALFSNGGLDASLRSE
jgi:hypothetical protein